MPVDGVEVAPAIDLVTADDVVIGPELDPAVHLLLGDVTVEWEAVGDNQAHVVDAASEVIEVSPEQHPGISDLSGPARDFE